MDFNVVIDGANISHVTSRKIVASRIEQAIEGLLKHGLVAHVVFPGYLHEGKNKNKKVDGVEIIDKLISTGQLSLVDGEDDGIIITVAYESDCLILTNDSFSDHKDKKWCTDEIRDFINNRRLTFSFVGDKFLIPLKDQCKIKDYLKCEKPVEKKSPVDIPFFKESVIKDSTCSGISAEQFPKEVGTLLKMLEGNKTKRLSDVSSRLKVETGFSVNDLFVNSKRASKFLTSQRFKVSMKDNQYYIEGRAAA